MLRGSVDDKKEKKAVQKRQNGRASRMTSLDTREPLMSSEVLPERTIMTTLKIYPNNLVVMSEFFGGGLKILEVDLPAFQISSTWVMLSRLQWTRPRCLMHTFAQYLPGKNFLTLLT